MYLTEKNIGKQKKQKKSNKLADVSPNIIIISHANCQYTN